MFWTLAAFAQEPHVLGPDSGTLADGRPLDIFSFQLEAGERVLLQVESKAFDPQAMLLSPDGRQIQNDDHPELGTGARVVAIAPTAGTWRAAVTTAAPGGSGAYVKTLASPAKPVPAPAVWEAVDPGRERAFARSAKVSGTVQAAAGNAWQAPIPLPAGGHLRADLGPSPYSEWRGTLALLGPAGEVHVVVPPATDSRTILDLDVKDAGTWTLLVQGDPGPAQGFWLDLELTGAAPGFDRDADLCAGLTFAIADARLNHARSKPTTAGGPASWKLPGASTAAHHGVVELSSTSSTSWTPRAGPSPTTVWSATSRPVCPAGQRT